MCRAKGRLEADITQNFFFNNQVAFLAHHTISGGCTRGNVVRVVDAHNVVVHPVDWWGNEKKEQEFTGRDAEGNEQYRSVSIEETVPSAFACRARSRK